MAVVANVVILGVYAGRTYPNTRVGSYKLGSVKYEQISPNVMASGLVPKTIGLKSNNRTFTYKTGDLGIALDDTRISAAAAGHSWLPAANFFVPHNVRADIIVNRATLRGKLVELAARLKQTPRDARIVIQDNTFKVSAANSGSELDITKASNQIIQTVSESKSSTVLPARTLAPAVMGTALDKRVRELQAQQAVTLAFTYNGVVSKPAATTVLGWYTPGGGDYVLNYVAIKAYINQLGVQHNIQVQNADQAVAQAKKAIQGLAPLNFALAAVPPGPCSGNQAAKFILVSLSQQHMWACEKSSLVRDSAITSGATAAGNGTPTGSWKIYGKATNLHLKGPTWDDPVSFWLPFYADYGFHDSAWQTFPYGDPRYITEGSHGCIHVPGDTMAWLYNWSVKGTSVTVKA